MSAAAPRRPDTPEETTRDPDALAPRVSIGMPLYNAGRYLGLTLDSILGQNFTDFELIVSDNASTDGTDEAVRARLADDPRIRLYRHAENRGAAANYNFALDAARAPYFKWAAYDDLLDRRFLERCVQGLDEAPEDVVLVYPRTLIIDGNGRVMEQYDDKLDLRMETASARLDHLIRNLTLSNAIFGLLRRDALLRTRRHGNYNEADRVTLAELALEGRFFELPEPLFLRRMHPEVSTARTRSAREIADWFDPANRRRLFLMPKTRLFLEHFVSIGRSGLPPAEKLRCAYAFVTASVWRHRWNRENRKVYEARVEELLDEKRRQKAQAESSAPRSDVENGQEPVDDAPELATTPAAAMRDALAHHRQGRLKLAIKSYDAALGLKPDHIDALHLKGAALAQLGRQDEGVLLMERAFKQRPKQKTSEKTRRSALKAIGAAGMVATPEGATFRTSRSAVPPLLAWSTALSRIGRDDEALAFAEQALRVDPESATTHLRLGACLESMNRPKEALAAYQRSAKLDPELAQAHLRISNMMNGRGEWAAAIKALERALEIEPDNVAATGNLVMSKRIICDWRDDRQWLDRLTAACSKAQKEGLLTPINPSFAQNLPFTPMQLRVIAELHARRLFGGLGPVRRRLAFDFEGRKVEKTRLRIAYMSEGFRDFPTSHLIQRLFKHHDREGFEILAYSYGPDDGSDYRRNIAATVDHFIDLRALNDEDAARRIHEDGVDILIDLKGYTVNARPRITALRPAPVQVSYLGYPGTWGCRAVDYVMTDRICVPPAEAEAFTESLVHLPNCYQVNDDEQAIDERPMTRAQLGLPENAFVFCCFNKPYKLDPEIFRLWMSILKEVPGSVLWLFGDTEDAARNLRFEAELLGVSGSRLVFAKRMKKLQHLARHRLADLFIDTRVYSAHTTGTDALWAGLPLIAWPGPSFHGRVAASLLTALGMPEMIVETPEAYRALAVRLAREPETLAALKVKLTALRANCRLFDTAHFALGLEAAYRRMWDNYLSDRHPSPIDIRDEDLPGGQAAATVGTAAGIGGQRPGP